MINKFLSRLNNDQLRWILLLIIRIMYAVRSKETLQQVYYHQQFQIWGYKFEKNFFWNTGPGWITGRRHFESQLLHYFANQYRPKNGDVVIDLGAGLGEESTIFAEWVGNQGKVYAIEATPRIAEALTFAKEANKLQNVFISNIAINNKSEPVEIADETGYVGNTIHTVIENKTNVFTVPGITLDDFFHRHEIRHVDLLKVNIEGAEQFMILGMDNSVSKIKNIAISCHDFRHTHNKESEFYRTMDKIKHYFSSNGFSLQVLDSNDILQRHIVYGKNLAFHQ